MDIEIIVEDVAAADELRNLRTWLLDEPEFRGRVQLREAPPQPGVMGQVSDALVLALAGGAGAALTETAVRNLGSVLISWLKARKRSSTIVVTVRSVNGARVSLSAPEARLLSADEVAQMLDELTTRLGLSLNGESKGEGEATSGDVQPWLPAG